MTELGKKLKEVREAKGMSLTDVQEVTKIQKRYLAGIEEGNYDIMPGQFYVRAFIKQYAEAVGLNADELFEEFKSEVPSSKEDELPLRPTSSASTGQSKTRVNTSRPVRESSKLLDYLPKILLTAFVIGALVLVWLLIPKGGSDTEPGVEEKMQVQEEPVTEEQVTEEEAEPAAEPVQPAVEKTPAPAPAPVLAAVSSSGRQTVYELTGADKFQVAVSSKGETWIEITGGNGKSYFSGLLTNGQTQTHDLTGQSEVKIKVGFAPATVITVNGQTLTYKLPADQQVLQDIVIRPAAQAAAQ